jgi:hypothetical protein
MRRAIPFLVSVAFMRGLEAAELPKLPEPFRSIVDRANSAPPEFASDALLRMVESGKLADKNARRSLVEQAFQSAGSAKFPLRMQALPGATTDTRSDSLDHAYALKLDSLSLQSRAVRDMLPLDAAKAREIFGEIVKPELLPLTCDDSMVYEPSEYYLTLSAVVNGAFTPKEKAKEDHVNLMLEALAQITSPSQLVPLSGAIQSIGVTAAQRQILWTHFNGLLESMQPDDRSFAATLAAISGLSTPGVQASLDKYRQKSRGCEGDAGSWQAAKTESASGKTPSTPKLERYWQSANAQQLLKAGRKLRFASNERLFTDADRETQEWQQQLADYLNLVADWSADQEQSDAVYYHEKCQVYTSLLDLVPAGSQREKILADYVDFISGSGMYQQSPAEWYTEPQALLERALTNSAFRGTVLDAFQRSGNPVLALQVDLEKAFGTKLPSWAPNQK